MGLGWSCSRIVAKDILQRLGWSCSRIVAKDILQRLGWSYSGIVAKDMIYRDWAGPILGSFVKDIMSMGWSGPILKCKNCCADSCTAAHGNRRLVYIRVTARFFRAKESAERSV